MFWVDDIVEGRNGDPKRFDVANDHVTDPSCCKKKWDFWVGCKECRSAQGSARRLEVVVDGLPLFHGAELAIDTTLSEAGGLNFQGSWRRRRSGVNPLRSPLDFFFSEENWE